MVWGGVSWKIFADLLILARVIRTSVRSHDLLGPRVSSGAGR